MVSEFNKVCQNVKTEMKKIFDAKVVVPSSIKLFGISKMSPANIHFFMDPVCYTIYFFESYFHFQILDVITKLNLVK